ncbi:hypothetical protein GOP47_0015753 [Adiantum capillus-veneris]|uniref:DNA-directed RNA polymerase III subunit RPC4 n=1 Tax=Adiantum capillus-veneris TaxID=13818 RepID=A0A9D4UKL0_ADICA|nr:hypothetical protein GOP47_0015753 [Adiantum capillus-veneris]
MAEAPSKPKKGGSASGSRASSINTNVVPKVKEEPMELDASAKGPNILAAENFTHGGVRKTKFEPKVPTRRLKKAVAVKSETGAASEMDISSELMKLVKQSQDDAAARSARRSDIRAPTRVAFGSGTSVAGRAVAAFSKGGGSGGGGGGSSGDRKSSKSLEGSIKDGMILDEKDEKIKSSLSQTWDLSKYYPITLPLRKPGSIELNAEDQPGELEEDSVPTADELALMQESDEDRYLFFQLPSLLPLAKPNVGAPAKGSENSNLKGASRNSTRPDYSGPSTWLEDLPPGQMGKLLVYRSGAVKLQLGGTSFEAVAGSQCVFAQELVGINATTQHCCFLGDVSML